MINDHFIGVTKKDQSHYWIQIVVTAVTNLLPLAFLWLIPKNNEIHQQERKIKESIKSKV